MVDLNIAEIPFEDGTVQYRYARYVAEDGSRWVRHGLFVAYHPNGVVASEGQYEHGSEHGLWRDFYPSGKIAAEGFYDQGKEVEPWKYWDE